MFCTNKLPIDIAERKVDKATLYCFREHNVVAQAETLRPTADELGLKLVSIFAVDGRPRTGAVSTL